MVWKLYKKELGSKGTTVKTGTAPSVGECRVSTGRSSSSTSSTQAQQGTPDCTDNGRQWHHVDAETVQSQRDEEARVR